MISRRNAVIASVAAVGTLAAGGGAYASTIHHDVSLVVDGQRASASAFGGTVGDLLAAQGITLGAHDTVSPAASTDLADGQVIDVRYGRPVTMTVDGRKVTRWTTSQTVGQVLAEAGVRAQGADLSVSRSQTVGRKGLSLDVSTAKKVTVVDGGKTRTVTTTAPTVGALLGTQKIRVAGLDTVAPGRNARLTPGLKVVVNHISERRITATQPITHATTRVNDASALEGTTTVRTAGVDGVRTITSVVRTVNGKAGAPKVVKNVITRKPIAEVDAVGTKVAPKPEPVATQAPEAPQQTTTAAARTSAKRSSDGVTSSRSTTRKATSQQSTSSRRSASAGNQGNSGMWDRIAQCESTGNWHINTGNGYYGGLQFDNQTWLGAGGGQYAPRADLASREQQIDIANRVASTRGTSPWACA